MEVQTLLLQCCALHKFHVTEDQNTRDQSRRGRSENIAFCAFHSYLVEVPTNPTYMYMATYMYMRRMHNKNLEIRIVGSSCCPQ